MEEGSIDYDAGAITLAQLQLERKDACQICNSDRSGLVLPNSMVVGFFDGKETGLCVAIGTMDGQLHIAKQGRIWIEHGGFGEVQFLVTVCLSTHDVLIVFSNSLITIVDLRGGIIWLSKLTLDCLSQGPRCCDVAETVDASFFSILVGFASGRVLQYGVTIDPNRVVQSMARITQQWTLPMGPVKSIVCGSPNFLAVVECGVYSLTRSGDVRLSFPKGRGSIESANVVGNQVVTVQYSAADGQWLEFSSGWTFPLPDLPVLCAPRVTSAVLPNSVPSVIVSCYNGDTFLMDEARNVLCFSLEQPGE